MGLNIDSLFKHTNSVFFSTIKKEGEKKRKSEKVSQYQALKLNNEWNNISVSFKNNVFLLNIKYPEQKLLPRFSFFLEYKDKTIWWILCNKLSDINNINTIPKDFRATLDLQPERQWTILQIGKIHNAKWDLIDTVSFTNSKWIAIDDIEFIEKSKILWLKKILEAAGKMLDLSVEEAALAETINNTLPIEDLIYKLEGKIEWVLLKEQNIYIDTENFVSNKSGQPFTLVYNHLSWSKKDVFDYFAQEFGYEYEYEQKEQNRVQVDESTYIIFNKDSVDCTVFGKKKESSFKLFNLWIKIIWWYQTRIKWNTITDVSQVFRLVKRLDNNEEVTLEYKHSVSKFNEANWGKGLRFQSPDNFLNFFWDALDIIRASGGAPKYECIEYNWYDSDRWMIVHWNKILYAKNEIKNTVILSKKYDTTIDNREQVSVQDFYDNIVTMYDEKITSIMFLRWLWAFIKDYYSQNRIRVPLMLAIWISESWKNTLIEIIMWALWFETSLVRAKNWIRIMSLEWTTQQPLLWALRDKTPLFLDEFTGNIGRWIEETMRALFNNEIVSKWRPWSNEVFELNSPACIAWERLPEYNSVINRSILLKFKKEYRLLKDDNKDERLYELYNKYSILDSIRDTLSSSEEKHTYYKMNISNSKRVNDNRWRIILVNRMFKLLDEKKLIWYIKEWIQYQDATLTMGDETNKYFNELVWTNIKERTLSWRITQSKELEVVLYAWIVRDKERKTRQFLELVETFEGKDDFLVVNMDKLLSDSKLSSGKKKIFNNLVFFLQQSRDMMIINWIEEKVWITQDDSIDFS